MQVYSWLESRYRLDRSEVILVGFSWKPSLLRTIILSTCADSVTTLLTWLPKFTQSVTSPDLGLMTDFLLFFVQFFKRILLTVCWTQCQKSTQINLYMKYHTNIINLKVSFFCSTNAAKDTLTKTPWHWAIYTIQLKIDL